VDQNGNGLTCGFIDPTGKVIVPLQFPATSNFVNGTAVVGSGNSDSSGNGRKFGFIDRTGKIVVNPQFEDVDSFYQGRAKVQFGTGDNKKFGFIS
jgi:hypothetical protein